MLLTVCPVTTLDDECRLRRPLLYPAELRVHNFLVLTSVLSKLYSYMNRHTSLSIQRNRAHVSINVNSLAMLFAHEFILKRR
jgi:hypothetical protein